MKILIPILGFAKTGGFRVLSQFANHWIALGHDVTFLCSSNSIRPYFPTQAAIIWFNDKAKIVDSEKLEIKTPLNVFIKQYALYKILNKIGNDFDIILANHSLTALPISKAKIKARKYYYIQAYEPDYYELGSGFISKFLVYYTRFTYKLNNLEKIVNSPIYFQYKNLIATKYVPCGLDLNLYYAKPTENINFNKTIIKIGAVGRVEIYKGTIYVLEAFKQLLNQKTQNNELHLYLAFGNPDVETHNIHCYTPENDAQLAQFYRDMDIIIAPAIGQYGAIHYPVIEAMACGTPIITTYYMPAHEINAYLAEPYSVESIVEQIKSILQNDQDAKNRAMRANYDIRQFDWSLVAKKMLKYFRE